MVLLPKLWGHATINRRFSLGIGDLYCDREHANMTHDVRCHDAYGLGMNSRHLRTGWRRGLNLDRNGYPATRTSEARAPASQRASQIGTAAIPGDRGRGLGRGRQLTGAEARPSAWSTSYTQRRASVAASCRSGGTQYLPVGFVHVNKAGGTAMRATLAQHARHQMLEVVAGPAGAAAKLRSWGTRFFHASASLQRDAVGTQLWDKTYTFALVRNPWARQVHSSPQSHTADGCWRLRSVYLSCLLRTGAC